MVSELTFYSNNPRFPLKPTVFYVKFEFKTKENVYCTHPLQYGTPPPQSHMSLQKQKSTCRWCHQSVCLVLAIDVYDITNFRQTRPFTVINKLFSHYLNDVGQRNPDTKPVEKEDSSLSSRDRRKLHFRVVYHHRVDDLLRMHPVR